VSENRVLRRIFGSKRDEVTEDWRKLHNEELHNLYSSPDIRIIKSRMERWAGHIIRIGKLRYIYKFYMGIRTEETTWDTSSQREDDTKMYLKEEVYEGMNWSRQVVDRA
jgi:hypothetical protein